MTRPTTLKGSKFLIQLGDGADPEVFTAPCALNTKGIALSGQANEFEVDDCDDPDAPTWIERVMRSLSGEVTGEGTLAMESWNTWNAWFTSGLEKNIRVKLDETGANNGGYFSMSAVLSSLALTAQQRGLAQISVTLQSNGAIVWTAAA